jgi:hypothetical protein
MNKTTILVYEPSHTEYFEELLTGYDEFIPYVFYQKEVDIYEESVLK